MTETSPVAEPKAAPVDGGCRKAAIASHLTGPLRDYFALAEQAPMPPRLSVLVDRIEAAVAASGHRLVDSFRDDLIRGLPMLRTFAVSLCGNEARADDLVQETLVRAWANRTRFTPGSNFIAWTFTILRNQFYSEIRKAKREVEDGDGAHAATLQALPNQEHTVTLGSVMNLIGTLPAAQRQALLLVGAEGFTYEEAAARLGCQVGTVKSRVSRARNLLVETLARDATAVGIAGA
ncbi:sigma-70 family RNA polymerase sigma factor [Methylobacterium mesophilicum SR1.6/6]|uniref:Sigma-70 family RNA polymerase sigma factor n=1 Tax=Methylobacterium mesophilicum SR1.6/6 TaxID=908290 RepID=A0A6B9FL17_9HYPH|nr:sigma-70 family RNA polymerase sigma factor [Methylobacterium mesophilicum]QGY03233.1 sigma-70 family RNA polymerase sigma factor [Methylobacterium mesophilicum SR1.6/6]